MLHEPQQKRCGSRLLFCLLLLALLYQLYTYYLYCLPLTFGLVKALVISLLFLLWTVSVIQLRWTDPGKVPDYLSQAVRTPTRDYIKKSASIELTDRKLSEKRLSLKDVHSPGGLPKKFKKGIKVKRDASYGTPNGRQRSADGKCSKYLNLSVHSEEDCPRDTNKNSQYPLHPSEVLGVQSVQIPAGFQGPQFKLCKVCRCYKPPRAQHCKACGRCVLRKDHHCYLLECCVGFYNHKFFILALFYSVLLLGISCADLLTVLLHTLNKGSSFPWLQLGFVLISVPELLVSATLLISHMALLCNNATSSEMSKHPQSNPFDLKSCKQNIEEIFGTPMLLWIVPIKPFNLPSDGVTFQMYDDLPQNMFNPLLFA